MIKRNRYLSKPQRISFFSRNIDFLINTTFSEMSIECKLIQDTPSFNFKTDSIFEPSIVLLKS